VRNEEEEAEKKEGALIGLVTKKSICKKSCSRLLLDDGFWRRQSEVGQREGWAIAAAGAIMAACGE